jgi:hypothetical protein
MDTTCTTQPVKSLARTNLSHQIRSACSGGSIWSPRDDWMLNDTPIRSKHCLAFALYGITWSHRGWFESKGPFHLPSEPTNPLSFSLSQEGLTSYAGRTEAILGTSSSRTTTTSFFSDSMKCCATLTHPT